MLNYELSTPVVFIVFNRPEPTSKVFLEIAKAKPKKLFVIADGPRSHVPADTKKIAETRGIIKLVDWECEVITNFSDINMGCKQRVSSGLTWVFEQVDEAIILEDDCLPTPTFFRFCEELLEYYRDDLRIGMISGDNFQKCNMPDSNSYYFSKYSHIWGWATWSNRWLENYDVNIDKWPKVRDSGLLVNFMDSKQEASYWKNIFQQVFNGEIDTWDYQWVLTNIIQGRINVMPTVNLISNIGFGEGATHTKNDNEYSNMKVEEARFPLKHPSFILRNTIADSYTQKTMFRRPMWKHIASKIIKYFSR